MTYNPLNQNSAPRPAISTKEPKSHQTLGQFLSKHKKDIQVSLLDYNKGEHPGAHIHYFSTAAILTGKGYSPYEQWLLSLPINRIVDPSGINRAILSTCLSWDKTTFLLDERSGFYDEKWKLLDQRAYYAGADFTSRLNYLLQKTPFETPFDGLCMDVVDGRQRKKLCRLLEEHINVFVSPYKNGETFFHAYALDFDADNIHFSRYPEEIAIKRTKNREGLSSTLDGCISWSNHLTLASNDKKTTQVRHKDLFLR